MKTNIPERIAALREAMKQHKIDAYIIPTSDPHMVNILPTAGNTVNGFPDSQVRPEQL